MNQAPSIFETLQNEELGNVKEGVDYGPSGNSDNTKYVDGESILQDSHQGKEMEDLQRIYLKT